VNTRAAAWLAWLLMVLYVVSTSSGWILYVLNRSYERTLAGEITNSVAYAAFAAVGFLISKRRPNNAIG
jgi:hypothetical protein